MLIGLPNRIIAEIGAELLSSEDLVKFIYYKDKGGDILSLPNVENAHQKLMNKQLHVNRKIPKILDDYDVNVFVNMSSWRPYVAFRSSASQTVDIVTIVVRVIVQESCLKTGHGNRDIAIVSLIKDALERSDIGGIGKCSVQDVAELYALPPEYHGFEMLVQVEGFKNPKVVI